MGESTTAKNVDLLTYMPKYKISRPQVHFTNVFEMHRFHNCNLTMAATTPEEQSFRKKKEDEKVPNVTLATAETPTDREIAALLARLPYGHIETWTRYVKRKSMKDKKKASVKHYKDTYWKVKREDAEDWRRLRNKLELEVYVQSYTASKLTLDVAPIPESPRSPTHFKFTPSPLQVDLRLKADPKLRGRSVLASLPAVAAMKPATRCVCGAREFEAFVLVLIFF